MYTEQEQLKEQKKQTAILVSLNSFGSNYRKTVDHDLKQVWLQSLSHLSLDQIAKGTRRCLQEVEYFPSVAKFIELAKGNSRPWDVPDPEPKQIEENRERVPMPEEFKNLFKKFNGKITVK